MTLQEKLYALMARKERKQGSHRWKTHVVIFNKGEENGYLLCYEDEVDKAYEFLITADAEYIHAYELSKTTIMYNKNQ